LLLALTPQTTQALVPNRPLKLKYVGTVGPRGVSPPPPDAAGDYAAGVPVRQPLPTAQGAAPSPQEIIIAEGSASPCVIKVLGVGGGGGNAVNRMVESNIKGVEFWSINTDAQAQARSSAPYTLNIGSQVTRGLGAGGIPDVGRQAAEESREAIANSIAGADLVFVTAGMGGGTGSGAAPIVAEVAKDVGALTVAVVTKPFGFEGSKRMKQAQEAIENFRDRVDTLIVVSNDKLLQIVPEGTPVKDAFLVADDILRQGVVGISEIIVRPGLINVDFADVRAIMGNAGTALMGIGTGRGKTRAADAAVAAVASPLLDFPIKNAQGIVFNIVGGRDLTLSEINKAAEVIYENVDPNANIIFGALVDESMDQDVSITVLATGFKDVPLGGSAPNTPKSIFSKREPANNDAGSPPPPKAKDEPPAEPQQKPPGRIGGLLRRLRRK